MTCNRLRKIGAEIDALLEASTDSTISIAGEIFRCDDIRWHCTRTHQSFSHRALCLYISNLRALKAKAKHPPRLTRADISERLLKNVEFVPDSEEVKTSCGGFRFVRPKGTGNWRAEDGLSYSPKQLVDTLYRRLNGELTRRT